MIKTIILSVILLFNNQPAICNEPLRTKDYKLIY